MPTKFYEDQNSNMSKSIQRYILIILKLCRSLHAGKSYKYSQFLSISELQHEIDSIYQENNHFKACLKKTRDYQIQEKRGPKISYWLEFFKSTSFLFF
jgi:hypothetical protein